ncbi:hypothetical protein E2C01_074055 [Portunus trituberculatus]|uniref:Uncharacterized protein n=1 Tax=Portunus trituberculatus TaxID=210409 RepID=A0A5B7IC94_PORTR|nr:hypothetical protein [Portunus trituberculatus]
MAAPSYFHRPNSQKQDESFRHLLHHKLTDNWRRKKTQRYVRSRLNVLILSPKCLVGPQEILASRFACGHTSEVAIVMEGEEGHEFLGQATPE